MKVYLTEQERNVIRELAEKHGESPGTLARELLLKQAQVEGVYNIAGTRESGNE
jgi:DNA-binding MarR family transcriptional regulator